MYHLTYKVDNDLLDINCEGREYVNDEELQGLGNSILDIGRRTSEFYKDLCAKEISIFDANSSLLRAIQNPTQTSRPRLYHRPKLLAHL